MLYYALYTFYPTFDRLLGLENLPGVLAASKDQDQIDVMTYNFSFYENLWFHLTWAYVRYFYIPDITPRRRKRRRGRNRG